MTLSALLVSASALQESAKCRECRGSMASPHFVLDRRYTIHTFNQYILFHFHLFEPLTTP